MTRPKIIMAAKLKGGVGASHLCALLLHGLGETDPTLYVDLEPQGDGAQVLAVAVRAHGTVRDFVFGTRPVHEVLLEVPTAVHGYYVAPDPQLNRATGHGLCDPDRLRKAAADAGISWVVVDSVKLPDPRTLEVLSGADLVLHVVANAFGVRTLATAHTELVRHAKTGSVHTVLNRTRKDRSEMVLLDGLAEHAERFAVCPVQIGHDGWVANAMLHRRSPFAIGNARATRTASAELGAWIRRRLP
ncbi:cellulose biosynthesis protein BcsQ [Crossiella equi]|uniref:Cellulose biosynthesis protein BcsQ n=1 Tax=Crossiella equi TaxID=130796 RepID=A0ABS5A3L7_9PSEU|nr:hypothetical protein [Crossiella equi]MBP2471165.1 cellulose biosynthesis protein BcsQ [Crossiella equi]